MLRPEIQALVDQGRLPDTDEVSEELLDWYQNIIDNLERPANDAEAAALYTILGDDTLYGLAWSLIHFIETAPSWPIWDCFVEPRTERQESMYSRARNSLECQE